MKLDPNTLVISLLGAIPSAAQVFSQFNIVLDGNERKTLGQICADHGVRFEEFLHAMNQIDWNQESPARLNGAA